MHDSDVMRKGTFEDESFASEHAPITLQERSDKGGTREGKGGTREGQGSGRVCIRVEGIRLSNSL